MKIEGRRAQIVKALEAGDAAALQKLAAEAPADVKAVLAERPEFDRSSVERLLGQEFARTVEAPVAGKKIHDVRSDKRKPWWSGLSASTAPIHPEPTRDVDVHGERFSKDDVQTMLRAIGR